MKVWEGWFYCFVCLMGSFKCTGMSVCTSSLNMQLYHIAVHTTHSWSEWQLFMRTKSFLVCGTRRYTLVSRPLPLFSYLRSTTSSHSNAYEVLGSIFCMHFWFCPSVRFWSNNAELRVLLWSGSRFINVSRSTFTLSVYVKSQLSLPCFVLRHP
jgi:hypothetical protein